MQTHDSIQIHMLNSITSLITIGNRLIAFKLNGAHAGKRTKFGSVNLFYLSIHFLIHMPM